LRAEPHRLLGPELKTTLELLSSYDLRTLRELKQHKPRIEDQCQAIKHLAVYDGFYCLQPDCGYQTRHLREVRKHMPRAHKIKAAVHTSCALWREVKLQTYFTAFRRIDYFVVVVVVVVENPKARVTSIGLDSSRLITQPKKELFKRLERDYKAVKCDLKERATIV
jgi:Orsellinic acid/F9775 biosynthesis cluster protein D